ncbi:MAG: hypothetical protein MJ188_00495 [Treponema sp.]|nr:hypothetical protein [Treponema sp.]
MNTKKIVFASALILAGLLMSIFPGFCIKAVVVIVGLFAVLLGGYNLYLINKKEELISVKKILVIKSLASIVIGLVAVSSPLVLLKTVGSIWKILSYMLAIYLIIMSVSGFYTSSKLKDISPAERKRLSTESFISLLIAVLLFIIPIEAVGKAFVRIVGIGALVIGVVLLVIEITVYKRTTVLKDVEIKDEAATMDAAEKKTQDSTEIKTETSENIDKSEDSEPTTKNPGNDESEKKSED